MYATKNNNAAIWKELKFLIIIAYIHEAAVHSKVLHASQLNSKMKHIQAIQAWIKIKI